MNVDTDLSEGSAGALFAVLADRNRRRIIERIVDEGPATATALSRELGITRQGVAKHLGGMAEAGVLASTRTGAEVHYRLVPGALEPGTEWLTRVGREWDLRLDALKRHVDG